MTIIGGMRKFMKGNNIKYGNNKARARIMAPTLVLLPGKSHGQRGLVGCSPWGL